MRNLTLAAAAAFAFTFVIDPAIAQGPPTDAPGKILPASEIPSGTFTLDGPHTNVVFKVDHLGFAPYYGRFDTIAGTIDLNTEDLAASTVNVTIQAASASTSSEELNGHLKSPMWFNVAEFPEITFTSTSVEPTGDTTAKVMGDLTLLGTTRPVTLDVTFTGAGMNPFLEVFAIGFQAETTIKRSEFGINTFIPAIGDEVTLIIGAEANKKDG